MEKKIYIVKIDFANSLFSESKEEMLKLWEVLGEGNVKRLHSENDYSDDEKFYWPEDLHVRLEIRNIYLHENQDKAEKAKKAFTQAKKVGLIGQKSVLHKTPKKT